MRAAVEVMNRRGVRGMTLADVARRLDLVAPAVMYYFKSKEELAATAYFRSIERYEQLIALARDAKTAREALDTFVRAWPMRGYLGASVQKISEHLNLTKGAFYRHLENKDDLIVACFQRTLDILQRTVKDAGLMRGG